MHEVSLIQNVFKTLEEEFQKVDLMCLRKVKMKIGELSNVEPILMHNAFDAVKIDYPNYRHVALEIEWVSTTVLCPVCKASSTVKNYRFACSHCGTPTNDVITGNELLIYQVEFDDS